MKQWNGLFKKEWFLMRESIWKVVGFAIFSIFLLPYGIALFFKGLNTVEVVFGISMLWMIASIFIPTIMLLNSIGKEMQRPDTWLHSTASMYKMIGIKMIYGALLGLFTLTLAVAVSFVRLNLSLAIEGLDLGEMIQLSLLLVIGLHTVSILIMSTGLLFGAVFHVIKPVAKRLTWPLMISLFLIAAWFTTRIVNSTLYSKISEIGPDIKLNVGGFILEEGRFSMEVDVFDIRTGEFLLDFFFAIIWFFVATALLEKKVRL